MPLTFFPFSVRQTKQSIRINLKEYHEEYFQKKSLIRCQGRRRAPPESVKTVVGAMTKRRWKHSNPHSTSATSSLWWIMYARMTVLPAPPTRYSPQRMPQREMVRCTRTRFTESRIQKWPEISEKVGNRRQCEKLVERNSHEPPMLDTEYKDSKSL